MSETQAHHTGRALFYLKNFSDDVNPDPILRIRQMRGLCTIYIEESRTEDPMAKKKASHRSSSSGRAKTAARPFRVIVDPKAKPSASAKKALGLFSSGVQKAYKDLARKGVQ